MSPSGREHEAKELPCKHVFCLGCVQKWSKEAGCAERTSRAKNDEQRGQAEPKTVHAHLATLKRKRLMSACLCTGQGPGQGRVAWVDLSRLPRSNQAARPGQAAGLLINPLCRDYALVLT